MATRVFGSPRARVRAALDELSAARERARAQAESLLREFQLFARAQGIDIGRPGTKVIDVGGSKRSLGGLVRGALAGAALGVLLVGAGFLGLGLMLLGSALALLTLGLGLSVELSPQRADR